MSDIKKTRALQKKVNEKHIALYDKTLGIVEFLIKNYEQELKSAEFDFLDMPKNSVSTLDFLISAVGKIQKGHRLALGLDNELVENMEPEINIIEGINQDKI